MVHTIRGFGIVNEAEVDIFLEIPCFLHDPPNVGNLISGSSGSSKTSLNIWKVSVQILLKPGLKDFEQYLANRWNEHNCMIVCRFLAFSFFGIGMKESFSSLVATGFSKSALILSPAL